MKIRFNQNIGFDEKYSFDLTIIPIIDIFKNAGAICITIGWLFWTIQFWFGSIEEI